MNEMDVEKVFECVTGYLKLVFVTQEIYINIFKTSQKKYFTTAFCLKPRWHSSDLRTDTVLTLNCHMLKLVINLSGPR